ncbi:MAG: helix-turn-helix transcriptional regulator [bacterium]|nr:helix-turn-helix transcriptional regulator [bacterium]
MKQKHEIRSNLRRLRLIAGDLTQQTIADRVGVTRQTILSIEKGRYSPSVGLALKLAEILQVSVEDLFELEEEKND